MTYILVMITTSSREEAEKIAIALLEKKLIACANIFGPASSRFWWQGKIDKAEEWMEKIMPRDLSIEDLRTEFLIWVRNRSLELGVAEVTLDAFEKANPSGMSADGMKRYWDKYIDPK